MTEPGFRINDRRGRAANSGLVLNQSVEQAKATMRGRMPREGISVPGIGDTNPYSRARGEDDVITEMRRNRRVAAGLQRTATTGATPGMGPAGANVSFATGRPRDPMFYWRTNNIPYDVTKDDELKKIREFCNTPDAPIWMGDYSFKPIGEVQPGEEVIGWRSLPSGRTTLTRTKVLAVKRRYAPEIVKVTMESGRTLRCTPDHQWANPYYSPGNTGKSGPGRQWVTAEVGRTLRHVIDPTEGLATEKDRITAAWLAGLYDGEGSEMHFSQSPTHNPAVYERIAESLESLGFPIWRGPQGIYIRGAGRQTRQYFVDFLNQGSPTRRVTTAIDKELLIARFGTKDRVLSIESEGPGEVVSMQTETGNYVAWGFASKNCRLLYLTHPVVAMCTDIFTKFPLQGMDLECKDDQLTDFYGTLFFDQLDYPNYLLDIGREYWLVGEAWPLGSFNEILGVWDDDELLNPDDVQVERSPFLKDPRFLIRLPETLRRVLQERSPAWEYDKLMQSYPELAAYAGRDSLMPVSNILLKQLKFKGDTFHKRGIPILMRGFRAIVQEEMLNAALDAIADRLYTPLILTKLGATAQDLGTTVPWIPDQDEMEEFNFALDAALAADFRALTYHWAIDMTAVLGRENVPDLTNDFDRIDDRLLMVYGLSRTMLTGANAGETYAADALNRDVVTQLMSHDQRMHQQFFKERAEIVAEAQEHFDYEVRGGKRYLITEDIYEVDEDGNGRIVQKPKLLVPRLGFKVLNLADEQVDRDFREALNEAGVPVPYKARVQGLGMDFDEMVEQRSAEEVQLTLAQAETDKKKYLGLKAAGLPIPDELRAKFDPKAIEMGGQNQPNSGGMPAVTPSLGQIPLDLPGLAPNQEDVQAALDDPGAQATQLPPDIDEDQDGLADVQEEGDDVPPESNEQRGRMPKAASLRKTAALPKFGIREVTAQHYVPVDNSEEKRPRDYRPAGKFATPKHVGMSYHLAQRIPKEHLANPRSITDNETESDHLK